LEIQRVANGKKADRHRRMMVDRLSVGLVCQTILSSGGTFRSAWKRSRQV